MPGPLGDDGFDLVFTGEAVVDGTQGFEAGDHAQAFPIDVVAAGDGDPTVFARRGKHAVGREAAGAVAISAGRGAVVQMLDELCVEEMDGGFILREFGVLSFAGAVAMEDGGHHLHRGEVGHGEVRVEGAEADRGTAGEAGQVREAAHGDDAAAIRAPARVRSAHTHDRPVRNDNIGLDFAERVISEAPAVKAVRSVVRGNDVGGGGETARNGDAFGRIEIEREGAFVGVAVVELAVRVPARRPRWLHANLANGVQAVFGLDLDDVGPEVGQQPCGEWACDRPAEVEDADALQRSVSRCCARGGRCRFRDRDAGNVRRKARSRGMTGRE